MDLQGSPRKSQKDGQEDKGVSKQLGGLPLALFPLPGPLGLPPDSSAVSLSIHHTALC